MSTIKNFKERARRKFDAPIHMVAGDTFNLSHKLINPDGSIHSEKVVLRYVATQAMTLTEGIVFNATVDGQDGIGGMFLEEKK